MRCNIARSIAGGGGSVVVGTYTGNGRTQNIEFDAAPVAVYIQEARAPSRATTFVAKGLSVLYGSDEGKTLAELNGSTLTVRNIDYSGNPLNNNGTVYSYIAFF